MTDEVLLNTVGLSRRFGGLLANDNISLELRRGQVHALLGPNGAGKTTLIRCLLGEYTHDGEVTIKRFERLGDEVRLLPRNPAYQPIVVRDDQDLAIEGVFCGLVRQG